MKLIKTLVLTLSVALFWACGGGSGDGSMNKESRLETIKQLEADAYSDETSFNVGKADALIKNYDEFATAFPDDDNAAKFLFKAGDLAMGLERGNQAIQFFDKVYTEYASFDKAPYALFLQGFVFEDQLKDYEKAKATYEQFIEKYPDHPMTESAQFSLKHLGKSPEELIREFEENTQETTPDQE